ncbi:MAG TPA: magnesium/cobalt transporter CorA [Thermoguttaceae bacterium]|nr:magnesium/cobalt transporter CorA [Thermoguttaceae bacterium]
MRESKKPKHHSRHAARIMRRKSRPGTPPGTIGSHEEAKPTTVRVISYDAEKFTDCVVDDPTKIKANLIPGHVTWIDVEGLGDVNTVETLGKQFGLHPLALEDVVNTHQHAKVESYDDHLFLVLRTVSMNEHLGSEQIGIFLAKDVVLTFREKPGPLFEMILDRLRYSKCLLRQHGADYLAYTILDAAIDAFFPILEACGERLDQLDDEVAERPRQATLSEIHQLKSDLILLRRAIWPLRDAVGELLREETPLFQPDTRIFLRDCHDHTVQVIDLVQTCQELCTDTRDFYLTQINNRLNETMKVLTIIATIFMPLSWIAGVYGMNFEVGTSPWSMPELRWTYGYPAVLALMAAVAGGMLLFFRRRGWLGR